MSTNEERAERGEIVMRRYAIPGVQSNEENLTDLLTDLRHTFTPEAFRAALSRSEMHYESEKDADVHAAPDGTAKPSAKYVDVVLTYSGRVPKADLQPEFVCDDLTDTNTQTRLAIEAVRQWVHDGDCFEHDPQVTHTDEE